MKNGHKKLICSTPYGTFTRTTAHAYEFVSVFGEPVTEVKWHRTQASAQKAQATYSDTKRVGVFPVNPPVPPCTCGEGGLPDDEKIMHAMDCTRRIHQEEMSRRAMASTALPAAVLARLANDEQDILDRREAPALSPIEAAIQMFPSQFGLRAFPGLVFKIHAPSCYMSADEPMLYTYVQGDFNGTKSWNAFAKGTIEELKREVVALAQEVK